MDATEGEPSYEVFKRLIGDKRFRELPRFEEDVFNRPPNEGAYCSIVSTDMKSNVVLFDKEESLEFIALQVTPDEFFLFDYYGRPSEEAKKFADSLDGEHAHTLVYIFMGDSVGTCRHGRSLYSGPFTMMIDHLPFRPDSDNMFMPLHHFIEGRFPIRINDSS